MNDTIQLNKESIAEMLHMAEKATSELYIFCIGIAILLFGLRIIMGKEDFYSEIWRILTMVAAYALIKFLNPILDGVINPVLKSLHYNSTAGEKLQSIYASISYAQDHSIIDPSIIALGIIIMLLPIVISGFELIQQVVFTLLIVLGPIAICLSFIKSFSNSFQTWLGNVIKVKLWLVTEGILLNILLILLNRMDLKGGQGEKFFGTVTVICFVFIVLYCAIPKITSLCVNAGAEVTGMSSLFTSPVTQGATMATTLATGGGDAGSAVASVSSSSSSNTYKPS